MMFMIVFGGLTKSTTAVMIVVTIFYFLNPMFTFYLANYQIVVNFLNEKYADEK